MPALRSSEPDWWATARRLYAKEKRAGLKKGYWARIARAVGKTAKAVRYALLGEVRRKNLRNAARRRYARPEVRQFDAIRRKAAYVYGPRPGWPNEIVIEVEKSRPERAIEPYLPKGNNHMRP